MPTVTASLEIDLVVDVTTPASNPFSSWGAAQQQAVLDQLQTEFTLSPWPAILQTWSSIQRVTLDSDYQETAAPTPSPTKNFVKSKFTIANSQLQTLRGYTIDVGNLTMASPCAKMPDCSHDCQHTFEVNRSDATGLQTPWKIQWDGVVATVTVVAWWETPAMVPMP